MLKKLIKKICLVDICEALWIGLKCAFKLPITRDLKNIKRNNNFRDGFVIDVNNCIKCGTCERVCPSKSISLLHNDVPKFDFKSCCYCRLCQKCCPKSAIKIEHQ